jgi:hypothetical protein
MYNGVICIVVGAGLMGFCGSRLANILELTPKHGFLLPAFAFGIVLLAQAPSAFLLQRIKKLESQISNS